MTDTTPAAIAAMLDGVTPGPWAYNTHREVGPLHTGDDQAYGMICDAVCEVNFDADHLGNARFIAAARDLVPALAAERDRLQSELWSMQDAHNALDGERNSLLAALRKIDVGEGWAARIARAALKGETK